MTTDSGWIRIVGARQHNLKNLTLALPKNQLIVITGVSGSGKSSLAFDTLYAEGQRRYVESLSAYARQFLERLEKPEVDSIEGLSPAIAIEQRTSAQNPRSTVATTTEIYDYLRVLYASCGQPHDPATGEAMFRKAIPQIASELSMLPEGTRLMLLAPLPVAELGEKGDLRPLIGRLQKAGFVRVRVDGTLHELETWQDQAAIRLPGNGAGSPRGGTTSTAGGTPAQRSAGTAAPRPAPRVEIVIDRLAVRPDGQDRLIDSIRTALRWSRDEVWALVEDPEAAGGWREERFTTSFLNVKTGFRLPELTPKHFSFNSHHGACPACQGLGTQLECDPDLLVPDHTLSLGAGAVKTWWSGNPTMLGLEKQQLQALAAHFGASLDVPFGRLPDSFRRALFHGTGTEPVKTGWKTNPTTRSLAKPFEGLVPQAQRLYHASESEGLRRNLARFMNAKRCPECGGRRLRPEILAVTLRRGVAFQATRGFVEGSTGRVGAERGVAVEATREPQQAGTHLLEGDTTATSFPRFHHPVDLTDPSVESSLEPTGAKDTCCLEGNTTVRAGGAEDPRCLEGNTTLSIDRFCALTIASACEWIEGIALTETQQRIAAEPLKEVRARLRFLDEVGLGYLTLEREIGTLSGGEAQRIRLATQIGSGLSGVLYVLDEPSIGLHQRDNQRLVATLRRLRDLGNTCLVVEHDEETMRAADYLVDFGPGAGPQGGEVLAAGTPEELMRDPRSLTGRYLSGELHVGAAKPRAALLSAGHLTIHDATEHNLKGVTAAFPVGLLTCVTGVSGSGKSTLIDDILRRALARFFYNAKDTPGKHGEITGFEHFDKLVVVDQDAIGRSPRSNPVTYLGAFTEVRKLFAELPSAKVRGFTPGTFSFNTKGGRCETCEGDGQLRIDMHFLTDVYVTCDACGGRRYQRDVLDVTFKGRSIAEVLEMSFEEATAFFRAIPQIAGKLRTVCLVGLGYLKLGQPANTLSGGEAQRLKLSAELSKRATGRTLYLLDEPTTGLHFQDIEVLLGVLFRLRDAGNTLIVIEHNLDVIRCADWVLDLGPGGGDAGGFVLAEGPPEQIAACAESETGRFLRRWWPVVPPAVDPPGRDTGRVPRAKREGRGLA